MPDAFDADVAIPLVESVPSTSQYGQERHDRVLFTQSDKNTDIMSAAAAVGRDDDITATQRMVSATWGSVLTTLLGMCLLSAFDDSN